MHLVTDCARRRHWLVAVVVLIILVWFGLPQPTAAQSPTATDIEALPDFVFGSSAIAPGQSFTTVTGRFIGPSSLVLISPDTTALPDFTVPVSGLKVISRFEGGFDVITSNRAATGSTGAPFNWVVFNTTSSGPYRVSTGRIPAGRNAVVVNNSAATTNSIIVVTADVSGILNDTATPNLRIQKRSNGSFTVATLNLSRPTNDLPFTYLLVNDSTCFVACFNAVEANTQSVGIATTNMNKTAGLFITPDMSGSLDAGSPIGDLKVQARGAGFFRVATASATDTSTRIPFNYIIFQPPPRWEELGPTGRSGDTWSIAVDPTFFATQYAGSSWGGVWKTVDAGMTWRQAWNLPLQGIVRLAMPPNDSSVLYAVGRDGTVYFTQDGGNTWGSFGRPSGFGNFEGGSAGTHVSLASPVAGAVYLCTSLGLYSRSILTNWALVTPASGSVKCTDVVIGPNNTIFAAFRESGVWRYNGSWHKIKNAAGSYTWNPGTKDEVTISQPAYRIAIGPTTIAILSECTLFLNSISNLGAVNVESTWTKRTSLCSSSLPGGGSVYTYDGYTGSIAISPENENRLIAAGLDAYLSTDDGAHWSRIIYENTGTTRSVDFHQIFFYPHDPTKVVAVSDQGPRYSLNRGAGWFEAPQLNRLVDGPPVLEFYNLTVSNPDMYGRVWVGGHIQDIGGAYLAGNYGGFAGPEGEFGFSVVAPKPINLSDPLRSRFRTYTNSYDLTNPASEMALCDFELPGPNYNVPNNQQVGYYGPTSQNCDDVTFAPALAAGDDTIPSAIAVSPNRNDLAVVGLRGGKLYLSRPGSDGKIVDQVGAGHTPASAVLALHFIASGTILVGYDNGDVYRITTTFNAGSTPTFVKVGTPDVAHHRAIVDFANKLGDTQEYYVATTQDVFRTPDGGATWKTATSLLVPGGQVLADNLKTGVQIAGLAEDPNYPFLYVATGQRHPLKQVNWFSYNGGTPGVFRSATPASGIWTDFSQGLPTLTPIVSIGVAANQALYVATQGRGIWWRRDVSAVPPNSGVNAPEAAVAYVDFPLDMTTTCSDKDARGWHHIHTLAFKLAMGLGAGDGAPLALWLEYDEETNQVRLIDPDTGDVQTGTPGEAKVLENKFVALDLAQTTVGAIDAAKQTVQIHWALRFKTAALSQSFQQFLQVQNDDGDTTSWDEVGTVQVAAGVPPLLLPNISKN